MQVRIGLTAKTRDFDCVIFIRDEDNDISARRRANATSATTASVGTGR
jgi:hypothetical protein